MNRPYKRNQINLLKYQHTLKRNCDEIVGSFAAENPLHIFKLGTRLFVMRLDRPCCHVWGANDVGQLEDGMVGRWWL